MSSAIKTLCHALDCPLSAEPASPFCTLHARRENKTLAGVQPALDQLALIKHKKIRKAFLRNADLQGVILADRNFIDSDFTGACMREARLNKVGFDFSTLDNVDLQGVILERVDMRRVESALNIFWFHTIMESVLLPDIKELGDICVYDLPSFKDPHKALDVYRNLEETYKAQGRSDIAAWYYEQAMHKKRETASALLDKIWLTALWLITGYGESPLRVSYYSSTGRIQVCESLITLHAYHSDK